MSVIATLGGGISFGIFSRIEIVATQPDVFTPTHWSVGIWDNSVFLICSLRTNLLDAPIRMPQSAAHSKIYVSLMRSAPDTNTNKILVGSHRERNNQQSNPTRNKGRFSSLKM